MSITQTGDPYRRAVGIGVASVIVTLAFLVSAIAPRTALAAPKGVFSVFAQCPIAAMSQEALCDHAEITSGEISVGPMHVPIDRTITLQGGTLKTEILNKYYLLPPSNGESISPTKLEIPGGLHTIFGCPSGRNRGFAGFTHGICISRDPDFGEVTITLESAGSPTNPAIFNQTAFIFEEGTALLFPIKIHLEGPLLGEACYLGSEAHPVELNLTDGTTAPPPPNQPISGKFGEAYEEEEYNHSLGVASNNTLVNNTFAVPAAEGCGGSYLSWLIDPLIDHTLGLESPAGHNTVILNGTHKSALAREVIASESFPVKEEPTKEETPPPPPHHQHWWWPAH